MSDEWGPWIEHDAAGIPASVIGVQIRCECSNLDGTLFVVEGIMPANAPLEYHLYWSGGGFYRGEYYCPVMRYRIRKPRGMQVLESLLADLPERVDA